MKSEKYVYCFGNNRNEGNHTQKQLLGGKGANLAEMSAIGIPVPPGFTITTETCAYYNTHKKKKWPKGLQEQVKDGIKHLENALQLGFGNPENPLLVSVRSGAAVSMPGMMDTVLNLGINDTVVRGLAKKTGNERFALDAYRRFIDMFGDVVMGVRHRYFEEALATLKESKGVTEDTELTADDLQVLVDKYKAIYRKHTGFMFPTDPMEQLEFAINAVFKSWNSDRAIKYRSINQIEGLIGTAVNVQAMVFGNMGETSGTGVCFTRNPAAGTAKLYGEFLINAQGEDVVAGIRTPQPIEELESYFPVAYQDLLSYTQQLEQYYKNMQDIEFTIQDKNLYILQTRNGKRTGKAAVHIAVDLVKEGVVDKKTAITSLVEPRHIDHLLHPQFKAPGKYKERVLATGLPASPGAAVGKVFFSAEEAEVAVQAGEKVLLVRVETSPEDVGGMHVAEGILTSRGGMTSHAAVVARGWGKPCVAGCGEIIVNEEKKYFTNGHVTVHEGDWLSINGTTGEVIQGAEKLIEPSLSGHFKTFMDWVDEFRTINVRTNADTPEDATVARKFGAEGIGLCRTEHMFFEESRILSMRKMIMASSPKEREVALAEILPHQKEDFKGIFKAMNGLPVTIRLLDPPLHEFLPQHEEEQQHLADALGISLAKVQQKIESLQEFNPMLGHRGCRLGITHPSITAMQTRAILEAAIEMQQEGVQVIPEIMIPLVGTLAEFVHQKSLIRETAKKIFKEQKKEVNYKIGTMIEVPRAVIIADKIGQEADFFSFGTNDLTQLTFGYSRDDSGKFLPLYINEEIIPRDPFQVLDREGVGALVMMGVKAGRHAKPNLKIGVCGEHGGDPESVEFFYNAGVNYVSCSPYRVPLARFASAIANIKG